MSVWFTSLNSGSNANCYYVASESDAILVDAGLQLKETEDGTEVTLSGLITSLVHKTTKTNKPMAIGMLEDLTGSVEFVAFSESITTYAALLQEGKKITLTGKLNSTCGSTGSK